MGLDKIEEFALVWFENSSKWVVLFGNNHIIDNGFGSVGYAFNAALSYLNRGECDFTCDESTPSIQMWVKDDDYWDVRS